MSIIIKPPTSGSGAPTLADTLKPLAWFYCSTYASASDLAISNYYGTGSQLVSSYYQIYGYSLCVENPLSYTWGDGEFNFRLRDIGTTDFSGTNVSFLSTELQGYLYKPLASPITIHSSFNTYFRGYYTCDSLWLDLAAISVVVWGEAVS